MPHHLLAAVNIHKVFNGDTKKLPVLTGISTSFVQGNTYAITGVSGSGKSTFMYILAGLDQPSCGNIVYDNTSLACLSRDQHASWLNSSIGLVFQNPYLIKELTVVENVMVPMLIGNVLYKKAHQYAIQILERVGLGDKIDAKPSSLSGGQQQRVALARALINKPAFLLADEPTGNLDVATGTDMVTLLQDCQREWGMGMIISTHDMYVADAMETVLHIQNGNLIKKQ